MNLLSSLSSAVLSASSAALHSAQGGVPGVPAYALGERFPDPDPHSLWTIYHGTKKDDASPVTVFSYDAATPSPGRTSAQHRALLPLARNAFRKLRALRHPNILRFLDGAEHSDSTFWIVTEPVRPLRPELTGVSDEAKVYGLLHVVTALAFLNRDGHSVHAGLRPNSVWVTPAGEWKLAGLELLTRLDEPDGALWNYGNLMPDSSIYASPEVRKGGWTALQQCDPSALDSYLLHLFLYELFNGPLPTSYLSPSSDVPPALPSTRGSIPPALFQPWRRLGNPNPAARLKTSALLDLGLHPGEGWWPANRLVKLATALDGFALASEDERTALIRTLRAISAGAAQAKTTPLPTGFLQHKVLPSLVHTFEFSSGGGTGAPLLLPVILELATTASPNGGGGGLDEKTYDRVVLQPIIRAFATPDRAMRMALLEHLDKYAERLTLKDVNERVWPHLQTGFGDVVAVIREATVKSIPLIAPKLNDRILNNDLLRVLGKTQTDVEPGIRTNTCILLSRLSRQLQPATQRKVLLPAFARALRDPFVPARSAGLMALMATCEVFPKEDLAGKVIPAMSICLVDREKTVRDQAFKAIDMFVKKCEALTASMPDTALPPDAVAQQPALQAAAQTQPGLATTATGAAGALAGWAFASVSKKLSSAELAAPIERRESASSTPVPTASPALNTAAAANGPGSARASDSLAASPSVGGGAATPQGTEDWGGDLMDVHDDDGDWDAYESGGAPPPTRIDPLAAWLSSARTVSSGAGGGGGRRVGGGGGGALRLGAAARNSALRIPLDMDASDRWDLDQEDDGDEGIDGNDHEGNGPAAAAAVVARPPPGRANGMVPRPTPTSSSSKASRPSGSTLLRNSRGNDAALLALASAPVPTPITGARAQAPASREAPAAAPAAQMSVSTLNSNPPPPPPAPPAVSTPVSTPASATTAEAEAPAILPAPIPYPHLAPSPAPGQAPTPALAPLPTSAASPAPSESGSTTSFASASAATAAPLSKEDKAARLAQAREERKARMAAAKKAAGR